MALYSKHFYNKMIRKYVVAFGQLFNNLTVTREINGVEDQREKIPLSYAPKEKFLVRLAQDANLDEKPAIKLPRLSFEITGLAYAPERKIGSLQKCFYKDGVQPDGSGVTYNYAPVPYDINFTLYAMTKSHDDALQIAEQIVPFFTPHYPVTINAVEDLKVDVPISLVSVTQEDTYDGSFEERRAIIWTFDFTVKAVLIGPIRDTGLITSVTASIIDQNSGNGFEDVTTRAINIVSENDFDIDTEITIIDGSVSTEDLLLITQDAPFSFNAIIRDQYGSPVDLTGSTVAGTVRKDSGSIDIYNFDVVVLDQSDPDNIGRITISLDDTVTVLLEAGYNIYEVTLDDGVTIQTVLEGSAYVYSDPYVVSIPTITDPVESQTLDNPYTAITSAFSMDVGIDVHESTDWEVASDAGFVTIVDSSYADTVNLTSWQFNTGSLGTFYIRARHNGEIENSDWSSAVSFDVVVPGINTPSITSPSNGAGGVAV